MDDKKALEEYVEKLIKEKNSPYVTGKNFAEVKEALLKDVTDAINKKLISLLSDEKVDELNKLLEQNAADDVISKFFSDNITNIEQATTEALTDFRNGYLSVSYEPESSLPTAPPAPAPTDNKIN